MIRIDDWILGKAEAFVRWSEGWGVSQRALERALITIALAAQLHLIVLSFERRIELVPWLAVATVISVAYLMILHHRRPESERKAARINERIFRLVWLTVNMPLNLLPTHGNGRLMYTDADLAFTLLGIGMVAFFYVSIVCLEGDVSRKKKLSWQKIKELFGGEWLPIPEGAIS